MVNENKLEILNPKESNLTFYLKEQGWFEKMTLVDEGWSLRRYLELMIVKVDEKLPDDKIITHNAMNELIWRKLTTAQGKELKDKCMEMNEAPDFPKANPKKEKKADG